MKSIVRICTAIAAVALLLTAAGCPSPTGVPGNEDEVVTMSAIAGVTPPVYGGTPVRSIAETDQYTGTVAWNPEAGGTFAAETVYTATIILMPETGYTFTGVTEDFFTVEGASTVTNAADSVTVTAVFPETGTAPADGNIDTGETTAESSIGKTISIPAGGTINLSDTLTVEKGQPMTVSVAETYIFYAWYLDGEVLPGNTAKILSLDTADISAGNHNLTTVVRDDDGNGSSASMTITITN